MNRWYRAYVGTCTDPKIAAVAHASGTSKCKVIAMWHFILEQCADANEGGKFYLDPHLVCGSLDITNEECKAIWSHMLEREMLTDDQVTAWKKRQYETDNADPTNAERKRRWREKHGNGSGTVSERPETETYTDTDKIIPIGNSRRKKPATRLSDDWKPSTDSIQKAQKLGLSAREIATQAERFRNHAKQNDRTAVRWDAAFDNWCISTAERLGRVPEEKIQTFPAPPGSPEFNAWKAHYSDTGNKSMVSQLKVREMEGRVWQFQSRWPPGMRVESGEDQTSA